MQLDLTNPPNATCISSPYLSLPKGGAAVRSTTWRWDDAARTLSWTVAGGELLAPSTPTLYSEVVAVLFTPGAPAPVRASVRALAKGGRVVF